MLRFHASRHDGNFVHGCSDCGIAHAIMPETSVVPRILVTIILVLGAGGGAAGKSK